MLRLVSTYSDALINYLTYFSKYVLTDKSLRYSQGTHYFDRSYKKICIREMVIKLKRLFYLGSQKSSGLKIRPLSIN